MRRIFLLPLIASAAAALGADVSPRAGNRFYAERARLEKEIQLPQGFRTHSQRVLSGNAQVCAMSAGGDTHFYSTVTGEKLSEITSPGDVHDGAFSFDGTRYATAGMDGKVLLWDTKTGKQIREFDAGGGFS